MLNRAPFVTGSRAYGTPHEDSDVDLKVYAAGVTMSDLSHLFHHADSFDPEHRIAKFGKLHIHFVLTETEFDAWKEATDLLKVIAPVTNRQAIKAIDYIRTLRGDYVK